MADNNLLMEERKESIVSLTNNRQESILRTAHFLTPSIEAPVQAPAPYSLTNAAKSYKDLPFQVNFRKLKNPNKEWKKWVDKMQSLHHSTWKKAGVFDAIMSSTSVIHHRNSSLIYGFVEKWCPVTNSFVFPWGEATVTLEDMMILGGYSVLGDSVLITPSDSKMKKTVKKLQMERSKLSKTKIKKAGHSVWMKKIMDSGSEIEHEAFLAYWLSRFVFPMCSIGREVLSIAVHLARGMKIALAPAVLAGIYQNMSLLKATIVAAREIGNRGECDSFLEFTVSAPLALVQVWIWERFPALRPNPNSIGQTEPRIARWHNLKHAEIEDLSLRIDSAAENFEWRPYTKAVDRSFERRMIYADNEYWASVETELDEELEGLIRCLRTSELVGLEVDCIEQYLPHRVAMQFGMDQDLPGHVARENASPEVAWSNYSRPIRDKTVYVPSRVFEPGVTTRYSKWWKGMNCGLNGTVEDGVDVKSSSSEDSKVEVIKDEDLVRPSSSGTEADLHGKCSFKSSEVIIIESDSSEDVSPPDSSLKRKRKTAEDSRDSDIYKPLTYERNANSVPRKVARKALSSTPNATKSRIHGKDSFKSSKTVFVESSSSVKRIAEGSTRESYGNRKSQDGDNQGRIHSSSDEVNGSFQEVTSLPKPAEPMVVMNTLEKDGKEQWTDAGLRLEERITIIEKLCDLLKTGKLSCNSIKKLNK